VYPLVTTLVVMGTANHYFLDAAAGAAVMGAGFLLAPVVMRYADLAKARFLPAAALALAPAPAASSATHSPIVSAGCQTSAGERIPRQRHPEAPYGPAPDPGTAPSDAGEGAPAAAR